MMRKFIIIIENIFLALPWMWIFLIYIAYVLAHDAPTPWHARCVYFSVFGLGVLSADMRDYVREINKKLDRLLEK